MITLDKSFLATITYFQNLDDQGLESILDASDNEVMDYPVKHVIFHENDIGKYMYIMLDGLAEVYVRSDTSYRDISIASLKPGDIFGDGAATSPEEARHTATVKTALPSRVFRIHKKYVLDAIKGRRREEPLPPNEIRHVLQSIPVFNGLTYQELKDVNLWCRIAFYNENDLVFEPGDEAKCLFVILEGTIQLFSFDDMFRKTIVHTCTAGQYFGEMELLPGHDRRYSLFAEVKTDARIVQISKHIFEELLERNKSLVDYMKKINQIRKINHAAT